MTLHANKPVLTLLGRPGCHLCEEFRDELASAFGSRIALVEADVDSRPDWQAKFGLQIPVLLDESGSVICAVRFDEEAVGLAL